MVGIHFLLVRTKLGKAMRAMSANRDLARVTGIPSERVVTATWLIGGALAGLAGFMIALFQGTINFQLGWTLLLLVFAGVIMGGIGSVYGAITGGVLIGLVTRVSQVWIPASFAEAIGFAVMIAVLLTRPSGIFGGDTLRAPRLIRSGAASRSRQPPSGNATSSRSSVRWGSSTPCICLSASCWGTTSSDSSIRCAGSPS
jgi:ABC-type branched-subunit amino acid transport system permease subunit